MYFGSGVRLGCQNTEGFQKMSNAFLVHRLTEHHETRHDEGHLCVGELWSIFSGTQMFNSGYLRHFCRSPTKFCSFGGIGGYQILRDFGELWRTFPGSKNIPQRICRTFSLSERDQIWQRWGIDA